MTGYDVGYGKPPPEHRFQKGKSGNPRGRPKKAKPRPVELADLVAIGSLEREAYRTVTVREGDKTVTLTVAEALRRSQMMLGLKGNRLAGRDALRQIEAEERAALERKAEQFVRMKHLKRNGEEALAKAAERGEPPPRLLPHPSDIRLIDRTLDAWVAGPETEDDLWWVEQTIALSSFLVVQSEMSARAGTTQVHDCRGRGVCTSVVVAMVLDEFLPRRFRRTTGDWVSLRMELRSLSNRELQARHSHELHQITEAQLSAPPLRPEVQAVLAKVLPQMREGRLLG